MLTLIGSRALAMRVPGLRKPLDYDYVATEAEFRQWHDTHGGSIETTRKGYVVRNSAICEFEIIEPGHYLDTQEGQQTALGLVPTLDYLFTLKTSHRYLKDSPHFWKTLSDWHLLRSLGATTLPWLKQREVETYTYKHPKLNTTKDQFFTDSYKYDHDSVHRAVAIGENPAYTYYMKDGEQVQCDKAKFFALPEVVRENGVIEEAAVLAIERSLVPHPGGMTPKAAWLFAFSKVCTSITSGWFRQYAYENAPAILKRYPEGYWERFCKEMNHE